MPSARLGPWKAEGVGKFLVVRRDGSIPNWTWFVLGAADPAAPMALRAYADECIRLGMDGDYAMDAVDEAAKWESERLTREARGEKKGDPDAPRHRPDNPDVLAMLRGEAKFSDFALIPRGHLLDGLVLDGLLKQARAILSALPKSREVSLAITKLDEAEMWTRRRPEPA